MEYVLTIEKGQLHALTEMQCFLKITCETNPLRNHYTNALNIRPMIYYTPFFFAVNKGG